MPMSCDDAVFGGDPAPVAFAKGKTKAQILAAVKATGLRSTAWSLLPGVEPRQDP